MTNELQLKKLLNKAKIPSVPPLLVNDTFVTDFREKAGIFNVFFANQCNILDNTSILPEVSYKTNKRFNASIKINFRGSNKIRLFS